MFNNEGFYQFYSSPNIINVIKSRRMRCHVRAWGKINEYKILVGKPDGKRRLGKCKRTREDKIKVVVTIACADVEWIRLAQDRV